MLPRPRVSQPTRQPHARIGSHRHRASPPVARFLRPGPPLRHFRQSRTREHERRPRSAMPLMAFPHPPDCSEEIPTMSDTPEGAASPAHASLSCPADDTSPAGCPAGPCSPVYGFMVALCLPLPTSMQASRSRPTRHELPPSQHRRARDRAPRALVLALARVMPRASDAPSSQRADIFSRLVRSGLTHAPHTQGVHPVSNRRSRCLATAPLSRVTFSEASFPTSIPKNAQAAVASCLCLMRTLRPKPPGAHQTMEATRHILCCQRT